MRLSQLVESLVRLGTAYARVLGRKLLGTRPQLPTFVSHYERDGIVLFAPDDSTVLQASSRCIACGQCDQAALRDGVFQVLGPRGPMAFVTGVARHSGEHDAAEITADATDAVLETLTRACPVAVPFVPLVALVRRRKAALTSVRAA